MDTSYVVYDLPLECTRVLKESLEKLCSSLKLRDGLLHTQFILSGTQPMIVEVSRRCPGDLYPLLVEYSTGFDFAAKYASYFVGARQVSRVSGRWHILRHTVTADEDAPFEGLMFAKALPVHAFYPITAMGEQLRSRQGNRAGLLFCEAADYPDLVDTYSCFLNRLAYRVGGLPRY